MIITENSAE